MIERERRRGLTEPHHVPEDLDVLRGVRRTQMLERRDLGHHSGPSEHAGEAQEPRDDELRVHPVRALEATGKSVLKGGRRGRFAQRDVRMLREESLELRAQSDGFAQRRRVGDEMSDRNDERAVGGRSAMWKPRASSPVRSMARICSRPNSSRSKRPSTSVRRAGSRPSGRRAPRVERPPARPRRPGPAPCTETRSS